MYITSRTGQAGGGTFKMKKTTSQRKNLPIECVRAINQCDAEHRGFLWRCAVVVMWPVLMSWGWLREMKYCGWLSGHVRWGNVVSCKLSCRVMWCNAMSCDLLSCDELSSVVKWGDAMERDLISLWCDVAVCEVTLCGSKWLCNVCIGSWCAIQYYKVLPSTTPYYKLSLRTNPYYKILLRTTKYNSVVQNSTSLYYKLLCCTTKNCSVLQSTTKYYKIELRTTKYYSVLQSTALFCKVLQSTKKIVRRTTYKVLLRTTKYYKVRPVWFSQHMKRPEQCAEQQESSSNITKYINIAPATKNESHDLILVAYEASFRLGGPSNVTKYCASLTKWLPWLILVTYDTPLTLRRAAGVTLQPRDVLRLPWNGKGACSVAATNKPPMLMPRGRVSVPVRGKFIICHTASSNTVARVFMKGNIPAATDTLSEWLRRWTRNPLGSARKGLNPLGVVLPWLSLPSGKACGCVAPRAPELLHGVVTWLSCYLITAPWLLGGTAPSLNFSLAELSLDGTALWLNCSLDWAVTWQGCSLNELFRDRTVTWLKRSLTELLLDWTELFLDWTVTLLNCYFTELFLDWTVTFLDYLHFLNIF